MIRPPQRWAVIAAWVSAIGGLSPVLWRVHMLVWGAGWDLASDYRGDPLLVTYVAGLCVVEAAASLLVLGLIRPWGEAWPRWVPMLGGRRIPPRLVLAVASLGTAAVTLILGVMLPQMIMATTQGITNPILQVHGWHRWFLILHYAPWPLWPVGLWIAIVAYARRHRRVR